MASFKAGVKWQGIVVGALGAIVLAHLVYRHK
jgi:hypothetical protein